MTNLTKAITSVMKEVKGIEKNSSIGIGQASYKGVADKDVKQIIGEAMQEYGLCIIPIEIEPKTTIERWEETNNYGTKTKQQIFTEVKVKYKLMHESGESIEIVGYGHSVDTHDKGAGKATTYALKYALLYAFMVPTGNILDTDNKHSNDIEIPPAKKTLKIGGKIWETLKERTTNGEYITLKQLKQHFDISHEIEKELEQLNIF